MVDRFITICMILEEELKKNRRIAIFPIGKVGTEVKFILENRYGKKGILVDNNICKYNKDVISQEQFLNIKVNSDIALIIAFENQELNKSYCEYFRNNGFIGSIRSVLEFQARRNEKKEDFFICIKDKCRVKKAIGYELIRIGAYHDGGYVMLDDFKPTYRAYSFGIGDDMSWDECLARKGIEVYCFDPTIIGIKTALQGIHFSKIGISSTDDVKESMYSINTILENNNEISNDLILKMDVEGAEWDFIDCVSSNTIRRFRQITFELHNLTDIGKSEVVLRCLTKLNETHQAIWVHANNNGGIEYGGKIGIPPLLEVTYVNKDLFSFEDVSYDAPIDIDAPNVKEYYDIPLNDWGSILD